MDRILIRHVKEAAKLNKEGIKVVQKAKKIEKIELSVPEYFSKALEKNKKALKTFEEFNNTNKKE